MTKYIADAMPHRAEEERLSRRVARARFIATLALALVLVTVGYVLGGGARDSSAEKEEVSPVREDP